MYLQINRAGQITKNNDFDISIFSVIFGQKISEINILSNVILCGYNLKLKTPRVIIILIAVT